jgi:hypothetical protein
MKIRQGFVSNSSSSSFTIPLKDISAWQLQMIEKHSEIARALGGYDYEDAWDINIEGAVVSGRTFMDNFDMHHFLINVVGVPEDLISWGYC